MSDLISRNEILREARRLIEYIEEDGIQKHFFINAVEVAAIQAAPAVDAVPREEYYLLLKRFQHLIKSDFIASFDEHDPKTGGYKRDIADADRTKELRPGHWLRTGAYPHHIYCSICYTSIVQNEEIIERYKIPTNFCPNCGAKMEGDAK